MSGRKTFLIYRIADQFYGLPVGNVEQVLHAVALTPLPSPATNIMGVFNFQGTILPAVDMRKKMGLGEREIELDDKFIAISKSSLPMALVVEEVIGVIDLDAAEIVKPDQFAASTEDVTGMVKTEHGLVLLHDVDHFLKSEIQQIETSSTHGE